MKPTRGALNMVNEIHLTICSVSSLPSWGKGDFFHINWAGASGLIGYGRAASLWRTVEVCCVDIVVIAAAATTATGNCGWVSSTVSFARVIPGSNLQHMTAEKKK